MKARILLALAAIAVMVSCEPRTHVDIDATETAAYADSTKYLIFDLSVEWPANECAVTGAVRGALLDVLHNETVNLGFYEEPFTIERHGDDDSDLEAIVSYYGAQAVENLNALATEDANERMEAGFDEDDFPGYECSSRIVRINSTDKYWVYLSQNYVYLGGAHGGVTGSGFLTFDKKDGHLMTDIIDSSKLMEMQPLLRKGVLGYLNDGGDTIDDDELENYLFLEDDGVIPLPHYEPFPTEDGLNFLYQQYEIAAYAAGMPSFTIPWSDVAPYLSSKAAKMFLK